MKPETFTKSKSC